ncbi:unnamed protein product [Effrenium voratum]|nr:unnamed protein product [Effrenium voratum]
MAGRVYAVPHGAYPPYRFATMYPSKDGKAFSKPLREGGVTLETSGGSDLARQHMDDMRTAKKASLEELNKVAHGLSEASAAILVAMAFLEEDTKAETPLYNPALTLALLNKLQKHKQALQVLDLSREVPRSAADLETAVQGYLSMGAEMAKEKYTPLLKALTKGSVYTGALAHRLKVAAGVTEQAHALHQAFPTPVVTAHESLFQEWRNKQTAAEALPLLQRLFTHEVLARVGCLTGAPTPAATTSASAGLTGVLEESDEECEPGEASEPVKAAAPPSSQKARRKKAALAEPAEVEEADVEDPVPAQTARKAKRGTSAETAEEAKEKKKAKQEVKAESKEDLEDPAPAKKPKARKSAPSNEAVEPQKAKKAKKETPEGTAKKAKK